MDAPIPLVILHLKIKMEKNTKQSIRNNREMEQTIPSEETGTGSWNAMLYMNHGSGKLNHWRKLIMIQLQMIWVNGSGSHLWLSCVGWIKIDFFQNPCGLFNWIHTSNFMLKILFLIQPTDSFAHLLVIHILKYIYRWILIIWYLFWFELRYNVAMENQSNTSKKHPDTM